MTVQDVVRPVRIPRQAGPVEPPAAPVPLVGRERPRTDDERQFLVGLWALGTALSTLIATMLLVGEHVWS